MESLGCVGPVTAIGWVQDGTWVVGIGTWLYRYRGWEQVNKANLAHLVLGMRVEDCKIVVWGGDRYTVVAVRGEKVEIVAFGVGSDWIKDVKLLPDYYLLAYAHDYLEVLTQQDLALLLHAKGPVGCLLYSAEIHAKDLNSLQLACGTSMKSVYVWTPNGTRTLLSGHSGAVFRVRFNSSGSHLLSVSDDRSIKLWNIAAAACELTLTGHTARVWDACYLRELEIFASVGEDCSLRIWKGADCVQAIEAHRGRNAWSLGLSWDHMLILTGGQDGQIKQWNVRELLNEPVSIAALEGTICSFQVCMQGLNSEKESDVLVLCTTFKYIYAGLASGKLYRWQKHAQSAPTLLATLQTAIIAIASTETLLFLADSDSILRFLDCESGNTLEKHQIHSKRISVIKAISGRFDWISVDVTGLVVLWQGTGQEITLNLAQIGLHCVETSDFCLYCGDIDGNLHVYSLKAGEIMQFYPRIHRSCLSSLFLAGKRLLTTGKDGAINVFHRTETGLKHIVRKMIGKYQGIEAICDNICLVFAK